MAMLHPDANTHREIEFIRVLVPTAAGPREPPLGEAVVDGRLERGGTGARKRFHPRRNIACRRLHRPLGDILLRSTRQFAFNKA